MQLNMLEGILLTMVENKDSTDFLTDTMFDYRVNNVRYSTLSSGGHIQ